MRVILNLVPVNSGGGQQQAFGLLNWLAAQDEEFLDQWLVLVGRGTVLHQAVQSIDRLKWQALGRGYAQRTWFDLFGARRLVEEFRADIVFHFTVAWRAVPVPQVVRSVYSNLYFPEIQFWPRKPLRRYWKRKLVDFFRLKGTLRADGLIFENRAMQRRAGDLFGYPQDRTRYISPSAAISSSGADIAGVAPREAGSVFKVLYLTTWHLNKNVHILPEVARELRRMSTPVRFTLSLDKNDPDVLANIVSRATEMGVLDDFNFIGAVHPRDVGALIESVDCLILLSQLECFSANVTEAWSFRRPLIISNLEWATSECSDAALYVDRDDPAAIAIAIRKLASDPEAASGLVSNGSRMLAGFNTQESRFEQQVAFLEHIRELGKKH